MSGRDQENQSGRTDGRGSGSVPPWDPSGEPRDRPSDPYPQQGGPASGPFPQQGGPASDPFPQQGGPASGPLPQQGGPASGPFPQQGYQHQGPQQQGYPPPGHQQGRPPYPPTGPFGPGTAPKPGIVPLRPLGVGEVLDGAVSYIRAHPAVVLGASAIVAVISQIVQVPLTYGLTSSVQGTLRPGSAPNLSQLTNAFAGAAAGGSVGGLITFVATTVLTGLLMVVVSRSVLGAPVDAGECWRAARPRILGLIGVVLLTGILVAAIVVVAVVPGALLLLASRGLGIAVMVLGGIAGIVAAIWVGVSLSLASPAYVLEGGTVTESLRRSFFLVKGRWWPVFGIQLLAALIAYVISAIVAVPFGLIGSAISGPSPIPGLLSLTISGIGTVIALTLVAPFQSGVTGLLYVDQRMRREAFDIALQQASAGGPR